ncbi:MAG: HAD family hydrolase [Saprospiraceae bacterium]|nr:HAD family hydrolase [Saprospiraceae bacterium]
MESPDLPAPIHWIFFDCFNTLLDDFDEAGDETGMKPISHIPVEAGFFTSPLEFHQTYLNWRTNYWDSSHWKEMPLRSRFLAVLQATEGKYSVEDLNHTCDQMMDAFHQTFPNEVRLAPGVITMLNRLDGRVHMGVVSNFFLPGYPASMLKELDLDKYFDFILDSAQLGIKKPGIEIYKNAISLADIGTGNLDQILFIGDNLINDVLTPIELGMRGIHFDRSAERGGTASPPQVPSITHWSQFSL